MHGTLKPWVLAVGLALIAELAPAAGFGRINVNSALGQPLSAEIDLLNVTPEDLQGMTVRLASPDAFREANVEYSSALNGVRFTIEKRAGGQPYIRVSSTQPISEPALNLLVEVNWPAGRLLRDYPVLLNPAGYLADKSLADSAVRANPSPPEVPLKPAATAAATAPAPAAASATASAAPAPAAAPQPVAKAPAKPAVAGATTNSAAKPAAAGAHPGDNYTIRSGDTLRALAIANRPASVSLEQTMLAMFEANRGAFINDSIHRIRAGKQIHLPTSEEAAAIQAEEASRRINLLAADFDAYRKRLADAAAGKPAQPVAAKSPVAGRLSASTEDATPPKPGGNDVLQISRSAAKGDEKGLAKRKTAADDAKVRAEDEAVARENRLREAKERAAALEGNVQQMRKLLDTKPAAGKAPEVKPPEVKAPEVKPPEVKAPDKVADLKPPVAKEPESKPAEAVKPAEPAAKPADGKDAPGVAALPDAAKPAPTPAELEGKPVAKAPAAAPKPEPSFIDDLIAQLADNPLAIGGGVLAAALVSWLGLGAMRRRRDRTEALFAPTTNAPEPMTVDAVTTDKASALVDTTGGFATQFDHTVPESQVDDVDPVAEADVYIAYGRDVQAEEILKEAMAKDPERTEILMKLLEIYAQRKDRALYAEHAQQLLARVGAEAPLWSAAMAMGYEIDPENALYHVAGSDFVPAPLTTVTPVTGRTGLDHDLGEGLDAAAIRASIESIGMPEPEVPHVVPVPPAPAPAPVVAATPAGADTGSIDFDLGLDDLPAPHAVVAPAAPAAASAPAEAGGIAAAAAAVAAVVAVAEAAPAGQAPGWPALGTTESPAQPFAGVAAVPSNDDDAFTLDFDLGDAPTASGAGRPGGSAALDLGGIDLDLQRDPPTMAPPVLTLVPAAGLPTLESVPADGAAPVVKGFGDIDLDLGEDLAPLDAEPAPEERSSEWHNVATKLDLARAYLEIGDREGAGEILREVLNEGDTEQRAEAARLVSDI